MRGATRTPLFLILSSQTVKCTRIENKADMGLIWDFKKVPILQEFYLENKKEVTTKLLPWSAEAQSLKI
jgi:hypothetical protein